MRGTEFAELSAFVAVADRGNFSRAATTLGLSTSTLSQTIRSLEERLGVRLFNRTTRSVALTEAGDQLLRQVHPALDELGNALQTISELRDAPSGVLRLSVSSLAVGMVIDPILPGFRAAYPDITLDIVVDDSLADIVDGHFDAGIRPGARIERDMIAFRVSPDSRLLAVASPGYLATHGRPQAPQELSRHNALRFRQSTGAIDPWGFERGGEKLAIAVEGSLITNDPDLLVRAAVDGTGIAYLLEASIAPQLRDGLLLPVLEEWSPTQAGFHLFYPSRRQMPGKLTALLDFLRAGARGNRAKPRLVSSQIAPLRAVDPIALRA